MGVDRITPLSNEDQNFPFLQFHPSGLCVAKKVTDHSLNVSDHALSHTVSNYEGHRKFHYTPRISGFVNFTFHSVNGLFGYHQTISFWQRLRHYRGVTKLPKFG